jgi:hypothetical protein
MATIRKEISLRTPAMSSLQGNSTFTAIALTWGDLHVWSFVKDVDGKVFGLVSVPANLAGTPNAKIVLVLAANATSGVTRFGVATARAADAGSLNPGSLTAETSQDVTVPATAYLRKDVTFPATLTLAVTPQASDVLLVQITHEGTHANDTLAVNSLLVEAYLVCDTA